MTSTHDTDALAESRTPRTHVADLPVSKIKVVPEENYRWGSDALMREELAIVERDPSDGSMVNSYEMLKTSIQASGIQEPVGVVLRPDGFYHIVFGFTRVMAAKDINISSIPAYVYDSTLPDTEAVILQMRENSVALKRPVNWVSEVKRYRDLTRDIQAEYDHGKRPLPRGSDGKPMSSRDAAADMVCHILGRSVNTMRTRLQTFEKVDSVVRELAKTGKFSYTVTLEFLPIKDKVGMTPAIVADIVSEITRRDPEFKTVTPEMVRQVHRWVMEQRSMLATPPSADADDAPDAPARPLTAHVEQTLHNMSPGTVRDTAVEMVLASLKGMGVTADSPADVMEKLKRFPTWERVVGMGIGSSQVLPPHIAGKSFDTHAHNYVMRVYLMAFLRQIIPKGEDSQSFNTWLGDSTTRTGTQVFHRTEFPKVIESAMSDFDHRSKVKDIVTRAAEELKTRLFR